jgi:hypothetical protein
MAALVTAGMRTMPPTESTSSTYQFDTLVSPLEAAGQPAWLQRATPQERRQLRLHQALGRSARREATQALSQVKSLFDYNLKHLAVFNTADISPETMLAIQHSEDMAAGYLEYLRAALITSELETAKQDAYLATLREELTLAAIKGHVKAQGRQLLEWIVDSYLKGDPLLPNSGLAIDSKPATCSALWIPQAKLLTEQVILLGANSDDSPCVAFIPGHPRHPLKQYPTRQHFFASLRSDLLNADLREFFSRFVRYEYHGRYLNALCHREKILTLEMDTVLIETNLRSHVSGAMIDRLLDDARYLIPTSGEHTQSRRIVSPSYGTALCEHLMAGSGAGFAPGEENEARAPSDWMAPTRIVAMAGKFQRWLPDLSAYRLAEDNWPAGQADAKGLYTLGAHQAIAINRAFYRIETADNGDTHIVHPSATQAYLPVLWNNAEGAWHHSLEQPQRWSRLALLRRLGPLAAGFDDERLLQLGRVAGVRDSELRKVYELNKPVPPLLAHVLKRERIRDEVAHAMGLVAKGMPVPEGFQVPQLKAFYRAVAIGYGQLPAMRRMGRNAETTPLAPQPCENDCNVPPADLMTGWFSRLSRAIFAHRYELTQLDTDHAVLELQRRYPNLPLPIAQWQLEHNRTVMQAALESTTGALPLLQAEQVGLLDADARLTSALEGFTTPSSINDDTLILAFRLLEHLDHWLPATALLLRRGNRFGTPLAELGETDVETTSVYLDDEEGWSTASATQILLAQDMGEYGFYRALLCAFSEQQRTLLGVGLNEPERLYLRLRELALARPTRARLLLGLPVHRSWLSTVDIGPVRRNPRAQDMEAFGHEPVQRRLANLLTQGADVPSFAAERYLERLLASNEPIIAHVAQLEQERLQLDNLLTTWATQTADANVQAQRTHAVSQLLNAWQANISQRHVTLTFNYSAIGALPALGVSLPAVSAFSLRDNADIANLPIWLQAMPNLRRLELVNLPLTQLPEGLDNLRQLRLLELSGARVTAAALRPIGGLMNLETLILNDMDVSTFEWTREDMAAITASGSLNTLTLRSSHISFGAGVFAELAQLPELLALTLADNLVTLTDQDVADLGGLTRLRSLDLSSNPLGQMPNISRMEDLEELDLSSLRDTATQWPEGLERLPGMQDADLSGLIITSVPTGAGRVRGLRMYGEHLPEAMRETFEAELNDAGNYVFGSDAAMDHDSDSASDSSDSSAGRPARYTHALRDAPGLFTGMSEQDQLQAAQLLTLAQAPATDSSTAEFFALLLRIDASREARRPEANIRSRIQALIRATFSTDMRNALHEQARQAVTCVDRDALVFSQMEALLHADQALATVDEAAAAGQLIALATSQWRMLRLKEHVTSQITAWRAAGNDIDYSEIELYFRIKLTQRLGLRDQPTTQAFTSYTRWVTEAMLESARTAVVSAEAQWLPGYLSEQPYWQRFLDSAHAEEINGINQWRDRLGEYLDAASSDETLPPELSENERHQLLQLLRASGRLGALEPLPNVLSLNSNEYRAAYDALLKRVEQARLELTQAVLRSQPGPSTQP